MSTVQDLARREAMEEYDVVGRPVEPDLQGLVELAAAMCDVPTAVINIIDDRYQHQVAAIGLSAAVCSREESMCAGVLHDLQLVTVPDASLDERFAQNPFVTGAIAHVRFYASSPIVTPAGVPIGTLCVFDDVPRRLSAAGGRALGAPRAGPLPAGGEVAGPGRVLGDRDGRDDGHAVGRRPVRRRHPSGERSPTGLTQSRPPHSEGPSHASPCVAGPLVPCGVPCREQ